MLNSYDVEDVYFASPDTGYAIFWNGVISKTYDGGTNWVVQNPVVSSSLNAICFVKSNVGYIAGNDGVILKTLNGGETTGFTETQERKDDIQISPNPANEIITIEASQKAKSDSYRIEILNIQGQLLKCVVIKDNPTTIDISGFEKGIYFIKVIPLAIGTDNAIIIKKFIKE